MAPLASSSPSTLGVVESKKRVRFFESAKIAEVSRLAEDISEKEELWYSKADIDIFKESNRQIAQSIELNMKIKSEEDCTRGLESKTSEASARRRTIRRAARNAVFEEQEYQQQKYGGSIDSEAISQIYIRHTEDAVRNAKILGSKDEQFVRSEEKVTLLPTTRSSKPTRLSAYFSFRRIARAAAV